MNVNSEQKKENKVLDFKRRGDFHARIANRYADRGDFLQALAFFRRAISDEPKNMDHKLGLAALYSDMYCYEKSNQLLFRIVRESETELTECYYGMGCNFMGMQDLLQARDSFLLYLQQDPDGSFALDAEDMLMFIEDEVEAREDSENIPPDFQEQADAGKVALDRSEIQAAIDLLDPVVEQAPQLFYARNNLALAHYLAGNVEIAKRHARVVLDMDRDNIHALCNMAIFEGLDVNNEAVLQYLERAAKLAALSPDEAYKAALTMFESGRMSDALGFFEQALAFSPYDVRTLFSVGVCAYNIADYTKAQRYFNDMTQVEEDGGIGAFYRQMVKRAQDGDAEPPLSLMMQVPLYEAVRRVKYLNEMTKRELHHIERMWREDSQFKSYAKWALNLADCNVQNAMVDLLGIIGDAEAEETLRMYLMAPDVMRDQKNRTMSALKRMGAKEPYVAWTGHGVVEAKVTLVAALGDEVPHSYTAVLELCVRSMRHRKLDDVMEEAVHIWERYIKGHTPPLPNLQQKPAWAAAIEAAALLEKGIDPDLAQLAIAYGTKQSQIEYRIGKLMRMLSKSTETTDD
jgi:tetratricopeptide (TPR) repeat protein